MPLCVAIDRMMSNGSHFAWITKTMHRFERLGKVILLDRLEPFRDAFSAKKCQQLRPLCPVSLYLPVFLEGAFGTVLLQVDDRDGWPFVLNRLARPGQAGVIAQIEFVI